MARGEGEPIDLQKQGHGETTNHSDSNMNNADDGISGRSVSSRVSPKPQRIDSDKISKIRKYFPGSDTIDEIYQIAIEYEENWNKMKKIKEVFGEIPFFAIQRINAQPFNFSSVITSEPPIPPAETPFQKMYSIPPCADSNTANDCDMKSITEPHRTNPEKPKGMTYEEYKKIRPGVIFDEYRKMGRTPITDWEPVPSGEKMVKRNAFGEVVDFLLLRKCGFYV